MRRTVVMGLAAMAVGAGASWASAQEVQVRLERGPFHEGIPVEIQVVAEGFEEEPEPELIYPEPAHGRLEVAEVSPNVSTAISIENGRISRTKSVQFVYRLEFVGDRPGTVLLGPFQVTQGAVTHTSEPLRFRLRPVPVTENLRLELELPSRPAYVGERIPVALELWLEEEFEDRIHGYSLRVPFFDLTENFRFEDESPPAPGGTELRLETAAGTEEVFGAVRHEREAGRRYVVIRVQRIAVPLRAGTLEVAPARVIVKEALAWQRDRFGRRRPSRVAKWEGHDRPRVLEVRPLPERHRPPSFAGAVGRGFSLEVSADRTVVQVGDPITLTLRVRGEGNLEAVGFPPLDAEGLLPAASFRVPGSDLTGTVAQGEKQFTAVVRVLDERVREVPALAYSWFDPSLQAYQSTYSRPVALSVRPARVVGARDVVRGTPAGDAPRPEPADEESARTWVGADLSIERDLQRLVRRPEPWAPGRWLTGGLYASSILLVLGSWWERRRRRQDPASVARRRLLARELRGLEEAAGSPESEAAARVARALRRMRAAAPEAAVPELEELLARCDALSFRPGGGASGRVLDPGLHERALRLARTLIEAAR